MAYNVQEAVDLYNRWVDDVKATVPEDQLLIYKLGSGWQPLCDFLGLEVPDEPYPRYQGCHFFKRCVANSHSFRVNDMKEINAVIDQYLLDHQRLTYGLLAVTGALAAGVAYLSWNKGQGWVEGLKNVDLARWFS